MEKMNPGIELDTLIAEKVMGLDPSWIALAKHEGVSPLFTLKRYSTDIAAAWEVVDKLNLLELPNRFGKCAGKWEVTAPSEQGHGYRKALCSEETAPHAICLAALKAVESKA